MTGSSDFSLHFNEMPDYLYAYVTGPKDSLEVSRRFWREIYTRSVEIECQSLIVEEDFPNQLSTTEIFQVSELISELFGSTIKIAHVDRQLSDMDLNSFAETVVVNRGVHARVFNRLDEAEKWIIGQ